MYSFGTTHELAKKVNFGTKDCLVQKHQIGKLYQENFNDVPEFYKEIIYCWVEFGGGQTKTPTNFREIRNQNICSLSNSLVIPSHFRQLCRSHTTGCYQSSFYKLNFYY
jgi:hypothetical protein